MSDFDNVDAVPAHDVGFSKDMIIEEEEGDGDNLAGAKTLIIELPPVVVDRKAIAAMFSNIHILANTSLDNAIDVFLTPLNSDENRSTLTKLFNSKGFAINVWLNELILDRCIAPLNAVTMKILISRIGQGINWYSFDDKTKEVIAFEEKRTEQ